MDDPVLDHSLQVEGSTVLLKAALVIIPQLQTILIATSLDLTFKEPGVYWDSVWWFVAGCKSVLTFGGVVT